VLQPTEPLAASTRYRFELGEGVADTTGAAFLPFASTFTTGPEGGGGGGTIVFEQVQQPVSDGSTYTSVVVGPEGRLYASTLDGRILRFPIGPDGDLGAPEVITSLQDANGGPRLLIGLAFDPASTPVSPVLWVTHTEFVFDQAPDWTAKISRLSGGGLETVQDVVVGLPRSTKGHVTNSLAFGPDGALYVLQGSNTAAGAPSSAWQFREESFLTAALLRVDLAAIASRPLDVRTAEGGGTYDPLAPGAPLTLFATGIRNAYDLVWHTNGHLYVPTNGAGTGGGTPGSPSPLPPACGRRIDGEYTGPAVPGLASTGVAQPDFLFRIEEDGYYGHPNPARCEWVLNGGNPTSGPDTAQVAAYPVGVEPDRNWRGFAYDFGLHYSPDGAIEYGGDAFGGVLRGRLMIVRHSAGDDVIVLRLAPDGDVVEGLTGIQGLTGFADPLDLAEDPASGNLYVAEYGAQKITLVRPLG
jgi:glucose/arabinose dehydrogenase